MGWDDNGLPTERRVQNYFGVRCDPSLPYDPDFAPPEKPGKQAVADLAGRNFVELCDRLVAEDEQKFEELWRQLGLSVDWSMTYTTIGERAQRDLAARVPAHARPGRGVPGRGADAVGRRLPHRGRAGRARGPRDARRLPHDPLPAGRRRGRHRHRDHPARADPRVRRAGRAPRRRALPPLFGTEVLTPLFGVRVPVRRPPPRRPREGDRHRDDLHVRRPHRRHLVARARPARAADRRLGRPPARRRPRMDVATRPRPTRATSELAGKTIKQARERIVELLRETGDLARRARADHAPGEVLREGRPPARDRHHPPVVHPQRRSRRRPARRAARARSRAALAPRRT